MTNGSNARNNTCPRVIPSKVIPLDIEVCCHNIHGLALMILENSIEYIRKLVLLVVYNIRNFHLFSLLESIDKFMSANKIELIDVAFLLKNTPIKIIHIELPEFRTFELMNF